VKTHGYEEKKKRPSDKERKNGRKRKSLQRKTKRSKKRPQGKCCGKSGEVFDQWGPKRRRKQKLLILDWRKKPRSGGNAARRNTEESKISVAKIAEGGRTFEDEGDELRQVLGERRLKGRNVCTGMRGATWRRSKRKREKGKRKGEDLSELRSHRSGGTKRVTRGGEVIIGSHMGG